MSSQAIERLKKVQLGLVENGNEYEAIITRDDLSNLTGRLLTLIDASFTDKEQRNAQKSILRKEIINWVEKLTFKSWLIEEVNNK